MSGLPENLWLNHWETGLSYEICNKIKKEFYIGIGDRLLPRLDVKTDYSRAEISTKLHALFWAELDSNLQFAFFKGYKYGLAPADTYHPIRAGIKRAYDDEIGAVIDRVIAKHAEKQVNA